MKRLILSILLILSVTARAGRPVFRAASTPAFSIGAPTAVLPTGHVANDILFLIVETSNQTIAAPTGYTQLTNSPQGTGTGAAVDSVALQIFWKRDGGSESAPTIPDSGDHTGVSMFAYSNCVTTGTPFFTPNGGVIASVQTNPSFTTSANVRSRSGLAVTFIANGSDTTTTMTTATMTATGNAKLSAQAGRQVINNATGTGGGWTERDAAYSSPDTTGAYTYSATYAISAKYAGLAFVLIPVSHRIEVSSWWQLIFDRMIAALNLP